MNVFNFNTTLVFIKLVFFKKYKSVRIYFNTTLVFIKLYMYIYFFVQSYFNTTLVFIKPIRIWDRIDELKFQYNSCFY